MKIKKILVGYDGSEPSKTALKYAEYFSSYYDSRITAIHVNDILNAMIPNYSYYVLYLKDYANKLNKEYESELKKIQRKLMPKGIDFNYKVMFGDPVSKLLNQSNELDSDLIVIGITGKSFVGKMLLGDTANKLLNKTQRAVLAVNNDENSINIKNVLVPVDIYEPSKISSEYAFDFFSKMNCNLTFAYVMQIGRGLQDFPQEIKDKIQEDIKSDFDKLIEKYEKQYKRKYKTNNLKINKVVLSGMNPGLAIIEHCNDEKYDLVVMNTHGRKGFKKFLLGSVANNIIGNSGVSVLVLKDK